MQLYSQTPLIELCSEHAQGRKVAVKMDAWQPSGSFKLRGMERLCRQAVADGAACLISSSGGNAGLSAAYVGHKLGIPVTVVVPQSTDQETVALLRAQGAEAIVYGDVWDEADAHARELLANRQGAYIPPFDHPLLWQGHATLVDELKEQCDSQPDCIILSVGGGGLFCGVMEGLIRNGWTDTVVIAVETEGTASLAAAVKAGHLVALNGIHSVATSLSAQKVAQQALDYALQYRVVPCIVSDAAAVRACLRFADECRTLVEPACGASLSVVYDNLPLLKPYKNIVVEACGGSKISLKKLLHYQKVYGLERSEKN
ncbi:pyridoxal-phosphate dependent enzyme [Megasphaera vaginalis (ex Srinivasan et al. 2021)]|uniref:L-serine ammonia-lyase n=1 Tax=Megasphaera vaginalis (ex Srinivasan et al. 2021) TaxID=1111454 RepID=U7UI87_9FIRM|nr:pyridoxal-phosphate dependent enzyme [Megasphaera vaginalis (ex Srinivasan et al. 2021)]ERT58143.1 pyridoxal-phosphate dependent protein [Megasphaera vaginalis (ex Srinivasan et al. 2021)]